MKSWNVRKKVKGRKKANTTTNALSARCTAFLKASSVAAESAAPPSCKKWAKNEAAAGFRSPTMRVKKI